jgi:hypothetical protein
MGPRPLVDLKNPETALSFAANRCSNPIGATDKTISRTAFELIGR